MATSTITNAMTTAAFIPNSENYNYFDLSIANEIESSQPSGSANDDDAEETPRVAISKSLSLGFAVTAFEQAVNQQKSLASLSPDDLFFSNVDITAVILSELDLISLIGCRKVSKCFYLTTKKDLIWTKQVSNLLPNVRTIEKKRCFFPPEQQFEIIYKTINNRKKLYITKFECNQRMSLSLLNRVDEELAQYQAAGGLQAYLKLDQEIQDRELVGNYDVQDIMNDAVMTYRSKYCNTKNTINWLNGKNYNGTIESIEEGSMQQRILSVVKVGIYTAFNKQEKFEKVILESQALKKANSSNRGLSAKETINPSLSSNF